MAYYDGYSSATKDLPSMNYRIEIEYDPKYENKWWWQVYDESNLLVSSRYNCTFTRWGAKRAAQRKCKELAKNKQPPKVNKNFSYKYQA